MIVIDFHVTEYYGAKNIIQLESILTLQKMMILEENVVCYERNEEINWIEMQLNLNT